MHQSMVKYEIEKSNEIGNGLLGIDISKIKDYRQIRPNDVASFLRATRFTFGTTMMVTRTWGTGLKRLQRLLAAKA